MSQVCENTEIEGNAQKVKHTLWALHMILDNLREGGWRNNVTK